MYGPLLAYHILGTESSIDIKDPCQCVRYRHIAVDDFGVLETPDTFFMTPLACILKLMLGGKGMVRPQCLISELQ